MRVVDLPAQFDDGGFELLARALAWPPEGKLLLNAAPVTWSSPVAVLGLLTAGQALREQGLPTPTLRLPHAEEVRAYWARIGLLTHLAELFTLDGTMPRRRAAASTDALLPVTPVRASEDVHAVVEGIQSGASRLLVDELGLEASASMRFAMCLSEACQNIIEHAGTGGWVAVQVWTFRKRMAGRRVACIAASDAGVGFRRSLEATRARAHGDRWGDRVAIEDALFRGISRFRDPGRGQGLAGIKRFLHEWQGSIGIRSGTVRLTLAPKEDDTPPVEEHLPFFPGAQVQILIPARTG